MDLGQESLLNNVIILEPVARRTGTEKPPLRIPEKEDPELYICDGSWLRARIAFHKLRNAQTRLLCIPLMSHIVSEFGMFCFFPLQAPQILFDQCQQQKMPPFITQQKILALFIMGLYAKDLSKLQETTMYMFSIADQM